VGLRLSASSHWQTCWLCARPCARPCPCAWIASLDLPRSQPRALCCLAGSSALMIKAVTPVPGDGPHEGLVARPQVSTPAGPVTMLKIEPCEAMEHISPAKVHRKYHRAADVSNTSNKLLMRHSLNLCFLELLTRPACPPRPICAPARCARPSDRPIRLTRSPPDRPVHP
jgi:hypothetical protein